MPLTSQQKHYIKKNIDRFSIDDLAINLGLPPKEISKYVKKHWGGRKLKRSFGNNYIPSSSTINTSDFNFKKFLGDNINYFILLFALVLVSYFNSLGNAFVSDDIPTILKDPSIGNFSNTIQQLMPQFMIGSLHSIFDSFVYKIFGLSPTPYRIINILFHLGSAWIIYIMASILSRKKIVALIAASLFAVHPILTESITWISGAPYVMYGFFALLSLLFYILSTNNKKMYYFSVVSFALALLSSNKIIFFPIALILYEFSLGSLKYNWKKIPAFLVIDSTVILSAVTQISTRIRSLNNDFYQNASSLDNPFVKTPIAITSYLKMMFWPNGFSLYQTELQFTSFQFAVRVAFFLIFLAIIFYSWKKNRLVFFWLSFMILSLATSLTPYKIAWIVAERYVYLGSVGVFFSFAIFLNWTLEKGGEKYKPVLYSIFAIIIIALSIRTMIRNVDWKDEDHLWAATVKVSPSGAPIHNNMGDVYARHGDYPKAIEEFTRATQINPGYADAYHNLANTYQMSGNIDEAAKYYEKALSINPRIWQSHQNLAAIYFDQGNKEKALEHIKAALELNPGNVELQKNLQIISGGAAASSSAPQK
jgi:tetratricopeptide (TPR) repeat protein